MADPVQPVPPVVPIQPYQQPPYQPPPPPPQSDPTPPPTPSPSPSPAPGIDYFERHGQRAVNYAVTAYRIAKFAQDPKVQATAKAILRHLR